MNGARTSAGIYHRNYSCTELDNLAVAGPPVDIKGFIVLILWMKQWHWFGFLWPANKHNLEKSEHPALRDVNRKVEQIIKKLAVFHSVPLSAFRSVRISCLVVEAVCLPAPVSALGTSFKSLGWATVHIYTASSPDLIECTGKNKFGTFKCKWFLPIRVATLFPQIDTGGLTSLVLMETELLMAAVIWSAGSETKSPRPTPMLVPFALDSHSHSAYLNTCPVMKANTAREEQSNEPSTMKTSIVWQLQGNGSRVTWRHWTKSAWVLYRVTMYSTPRWYMQCTCTGYF